MQDVEIVSLLAAGDVRGLEAAYAVYADRIHDYAAWMLRSADAAAAADVVQDTFLIALAKAGAIRDATRLRSWLYAVARNECLRVLRASGRSEPLESDDGTPHPAVAAAEAGGSTDMSTGLSRDDLRELVHAAAAGLSPKDREVFELGMRHDLQAAEIGKALGIADNQAHAVLSRVRAQFSRALGALVVARQGRGTCADLDGLLAGWDGGFDPLWRKRIARHVDGCATCAAVQSREVSASALLAVLPFAAAPVLLRGRLFGPDADPQALVGYSRALAERAGPFDPDGFPVPLERYEAAAVAAAAPPPPPPPPPPAAPPAPVARPAKRRRGLAVAAALLLLLGGGGTWVAAQGGGGGGDIPLAAADPTATPSATATPRSASPPPPAAGDVDDDEPPVVAPEPTAAPQPEPSPEPEPSGAPSPRPTLTAGPVFTAVPAGTLRVVPSSLTLAPGGTGTVRLVAVGGPVSWTATKEGLASRYVALSASSGSLATGGSATVPVTVSSGTPRAVTQLVVVFGPGDHRLVITVDHPPVPG